MTNALFDFILETLPKGKTILELGSGEGTAKLVEHYKVYSIENYEPILDIYHNNYIYVPLVPFTDPNHPQSNMCYDPEILKEKLPPSYDLILVDGPAGWYGRGGFDFYIDLFRKDVPIVFDDVNRSRDFMVMDSVAKKLDRNYRAFDTESKKTLFGCISMEKRRK